MKAQEFHEENAATYEERHDNDTTRWMRKAEERIISKYRNGLSIDIGCGILSRGKIGCDIAENMLRKAEGIRAMAAAESLPFRSSSFDTVLCMFTALNMTDYSRAAEEMSRILKHGGTAILSVSSCWDASGEPLWRRRRGTPGMKRMRIEKRRIQFNMFTKQQLIDIFSHNGMELVHFESLFILQKPYWGWFRRFSFSEKLKLHLEQLIKTSEAGRMYFMVFRKV